MKRIGNLFDKICSIDNLKVADKNARKGKLRSYGVRMHDQNRGDNIRALHVSLLNGTFKTSPYYIFKIYEPKERIIYRLPYYPDRIVHHAIMNMLEPIWVAMFTKDTYSCIKNRGIHGCAKAVRKSLRVDPDGTRYCLKLDIKKFYPSIDHKILKEVIRRKIKDARLLALLDEIIESVDAGVPIGNYLSQFFANVYLTYFDHWVKEELRVKHYFRYADDIVILSSNKKQLHIWFRLIRDYLYNNLKLSVKDNWQVFPVDVRGIDFVGYVFRHKYTLLRKSTKKNLCRRVAKIRHMNVHIPRAKWKRWISPWWGWCKYCNSQNQFDVLSFRRLNRHFIFNIFIL
jgi:RNA-directed DNA polymerase